MREFFRQTAKELEAGRPVMLVSILRSGGSTPRHTGAMMAVFQDGRSTGTIGGGNVDYESQKLSGQLLSRGESTSRAYCFTPGAAASLGMVCGGDVTVHFQYLPADDAAAAVMRAAERAAGGSENAWLVRRLDGDAVRETLVASAEDPRIPAALRGTLLTGRSVLAEGEERWLSIPIARAGLVYIFGGGHVSQALAPVLERVGFRTVIYDDRPEFADRSRFPGAERVLCGDFARLQEQVQISPDDYVVIMTRGHLADYEVLARTLRSGARYLGCIGSRKKLALCRERLLAAGFTAEEYARVHAPIGLAIGAETPEEIAVSVAAELIAVRSGKA